ncbi:MAG: 50S ribosome-binding GTPase [Bdellovibrionales bacterium]|nr:50S ribosome-binding GTPase [Bdellovibrionales bacterium]
MGLGKSELSFTVLKPEDVPEAKHPRWAVLGRSNVGKSSLLNSLTHPIEMFKTGRTPGVTRGLIGVKVRLGKSEDSTLELVDLPGFGYAVKGSISVDNWGVLAESLRERSQERGLLWIWLADPTRAPEELERGLLEWLGEEPFMFVFTKADAVKAKQHAQIERTWESIIANATEGPFWVSSLKGEGMEALAKSARNFVRLHA